jgi:hypothetical protein
MRAISASPIFVSGALVLLGRQNRAVVRPGQGYPPDTLLRMCEEIPNIRAIKDWCGNL